MINIKDNQWIPSDGYKYISNGEVWSEHIYLGQNDDISHWHDTNEEPSEPPEPEEEATEQDYRDSLNRLGVDL